MKKFIILTITVLILSNCELYYPFILYTPHMGFIPTNQEEIEYWTLMNIRHERSDMEIYNETDYWATVPEIEEKMEDDCDGLCIYFINACCYYFKNEYEITIFQKKNAGNRHTSVRFNGKWFYPPPGDINNWYVWEILSYRKAMYLTEYEW